MNEQLNKILCVEDDPDIQMIIGMALEAGGFSVLVCSSGEEALERGPEFNPDLILLDVMMPGMDGPTTLTAIRKLASLSTKDVIFMTAKVQPHEVSQYRALGALDVIAKPFDPVTLPEQIRTIWQKKHG